MNQEIIKMMQNYQSSLKLNAMLTATIVAMSKSLVECDTALTTEIAELILKETLKQYKENAMVQSDERNFKVVMDLMEEIFAEIQVKKLLHNLHNN